MLATNTKTRKTTAETVAAVLVHHDTDKYDLKIKVGGGTSVIHTTSSHLFCDNTGHRWVKAAALKYGTHLRTPGGGSTDTGLPSRPALQPRPLLETAYDSIIREGTSFFMPSALPGRSRGLKHCSDGQAALDNSIEVTPEGRGQVFRRVGISNDEFVVLDRTGQVPCDCGEGSGWNDIWHGHVRDWAASHRECRLCSGELGW